MQRLFKINLILLIALFLLGCDSKKNNEETSSYRPESTGPINVVSVFSDPQLYQILEPNLNDSLLFGKVFPGLYYPPESMFNVRPFDINVLENFKRTRLILKITQGEPQITLSKNKYAKPQGFIEVSGKNYNQIVNLLYENQDTIIKLYRSVDREFLLDGFKNKKKHTPELSNLGVNMLIPTNFTLVESNDNFVWYRRDEVNTVRNRNANNNLINHSSNDILNILVYKVNYKKDDLDLNSLIRVRDSITSKYTEGEREPEYQYIGEDSTRMLVSDYIQTEQMPLLKDYYDFNKINTKQNGLTAYESQGWWSMSISQMGGPYTTKAILDSDNNTLYIADAILFAPLNQGKSKKRDYITQMEGLFTTFKLTQ